MYIIHLRLILKNCIEKTNFINLRCVLLLWCTLDNRLFRQTIVTELLNAIEVEIINLYIT